MAATLDEVLNLAKSTHALSQEQLSRILVLAPTMSEADLEKMKNMLMGVQEAEVKDVKASIAVLKNAAAAQAGWKADKAHAVLEQKEAAQLNTDAAQAEALIKTI
jgi:hypothetical protein